MTPLNIVIWQPAAARRKFRLDEPFRALARDHHVWFNPSEQGAPPPDEAAVALARADAIVAGWGCPEIPEGFYEHTPRLRMVALIGASVKPLRPHEAWDRGVVVTNTAAAIAEAVAEYMAGAVLLWLHKYDHYDRRMKAREDWFAVKGGYLQRSLCDITVGLVGCGLIGERFGAHLRQFGASVRVFDPYVQPDRLASIGFEVIDSLDELLAGCDVISLHAGATPETHHMIGARELALMRDGALFMNSARGSLVNEAELVDELQTGRIDAFLDVFEREPLPGDHVLRSLPNVTLAPHTAASSNLTVYRRMAQEVCENLGLLARGAPLRSVVTPTMLLRMT